MAKNEDMSGLVDSSPELVLVVEPGTLALAFPQPADVTRAEMALDGLLSDALFGEVIDISDLIPRVLSSSAEAAAQPVTDAAGTGFGGQDAGEVAFAANHAAGVLTILYDDDILASDVGSASGW
jgi:hypothetical protein